MIDQNPPEGALVELTLLVEGSQAVSGTMAITSVVLFCVTRINWG